jgi:hypothetical protein
MIKRVAFPLVVAILVGCASGSKPSSVTSGGQEAAEIAGAKAIFGSEDGVTVPSDNLDSKPAKTPAAQRSKPRVSSKPKVSSSASSSYQGLSYWIERLDGSGAQRVTTSTVFRGGDRIRLHVLSNRPGYLYIVNQGSSGRTAVLFPNATVAGEYVEPGRTYDIPASGHIRFDEQSGQEVLWIFLSQRPLPADNPGSGGYAMRNASYNTCGSKDLMVEEPENLGRSCGVGAKDLVVEDDARDSAPAEYAVSPVSALEKGSILALRLVLRHE